MNEAFEKILERLSNIYRVVKTDEDAEWNRAIYKSTEIVQEVAEEYNGGWIPCSVRLPEENQEVMLQDFYGNITIGKMKITDGIEGFSDGDWWASANNYVAWQQLPKPFKERDSD